MNENVIKTVIGATGIAGTEVIQNIPLFDPAQITTVGNLIIQLAIGLFTIIGIFKKKKH